MYPNEGQASNAVTSQGSKIAQERESITDTLSRLVGLSNELREHSLNIEGQLGIGSPSKSAEGIIQTQQPPTPANALRFLEQHLRQTECSLQNIHRHIFG